jgi:hypothetical protein
MMQKKTMGRTATTPGARRRKARKLTPVEKRQMKRRSRRRPALDVVPVQEATRPPVRAATFVGRKSKRRKPKPVSFPIPS